MTNQPDPIRNLTVDGDAVRAAMAPFLADPPEVLLAPWRQERATEEKALAAVPRTSSCRGSCARCHRPCWPRPA